MSEKIIEIKCYEKIPKLQPYLNVESIMFSPRKKNFIWQPGVVGKCNKTITKVILLQNTTDFYNLLYSA